MSFSLPPDMLEATRLTRAGNLAEATSLIQRALSGQAAPAPHPAPRPAPSGPTVIEGEFEAVDAPASGKSRAGLGETLRRMASHAKSLKTGLAGGEARPAAPPLPEGARFVTQSYSTAAGSRSYKLYIPANLPEGPRPLVVMLHGCTQCPDDFAAGTGMNAVAEEHGLLVAYPEQPSSANPQRCWNWFNPQDQRRDQGEPSLIAGLTRQILREHEADPSRVYIAGLSAGGAAAAVAGAAYPELFAGVGVHSGLPLGAARDIPSAFNAMRQGPAGAGQDRLEVPTIVFHGDNDGTVHPRNAEIVVAQATAGAPRLTATLERGTAPGGQAYSRMVHADATGRPRCEHWTLHGAGHAWAGGSPSGSYTDPRGPDAARAMVRFFLEQPPARRH